MRWACILLILSSSCCLGLDLTLKDGTSFKDIRLRQKDDIGIKFLHEAGVAFVDYQDLTEADGLTFGYEPEKYAAAKAKPATPPAPQPLQAQNAGRSVPSRVTLPPPPTAVAPPSRIDYEPSTPRTSSTSSPASSGRCTAITKKGHQCSRSAAAGSTRCWQH